jgi:PAS domain S-box-containing protein
MSDPPRTFPPRDPPETGRDPGAGSLLSSLIDALGDAVVVIDRERRVVAANPRYVAAFGSRRADVVGTSCTDTLHRPEASDRCAACGVIEDRTAQRQLRRLADASGAMRRYESTFSPILDADGGIRYVVEVWRDVTERSQLEVQLSHSERLASVGVLAAGVAHEINNPLASMLAGIEGLARWLDRGRFDEQGVREARETIGIIEREIERGRAIIEKLMLLGRSYDAAPGWVDLNQAARDTLELLRYDLRRRGIEVNEALDPELPRIWAREAAMRGICMNLMINSVQAMSDGGRLGVTTIRSGDHVRLSIQDTGTGIAPQHLGRIWDPFFTTKPVGQGTGLGLSITSGLVSRHGGRIVVDSAPGRGARFDVELPIHGPGGET